MQCDEIKERVLILENDMKYIKKSYEGLKEDNQRLSAKIDGVNDKLDAKFDKLDAKLDKLAEEFRKTSAEIKAEVASRFIPIYLVITFFAATEMGNAKNFVNFFK